MKIYKISQYENNDYDTYNSVVVVAHNEEEAKLIHPDDSHYKFINDCWWFICNDGSKHKEEYSHEWVSDLTKIIVEEIGEADSKYIKPQVILASFNAG